MFQEYFNHASQLIYIIAAEGDIIEVNFAALTLTGIERSQAIGQSLWDLPCWIHSEQVQNTVMFSMEYCVLTMEDTRFPVQYKDFRGEIVDLDFVMKPVFNKQEQLEYFVGLGYNVTEIVQTRKALSEQERQMRALFESSNDGFLFNMLPDSINVAQLSLEEVLDYIVDTQHLTQWNSTFKDIFVMNDDEIKNVKNIQALLQISKAQLREHYREMITSGKSGLEYTITNQKGKIKTLQLQFTAIFGDELYYGSFCVVTDITLRRQYELKLQELAACDFMTGLFNRRTFYKKAKALIDEERSTLIAMLDIDHFKRINDTYGHSVGDAVLKNFASSMVNHFDKHGVTARLGGEEFGLIFSGIDSDKGLQLLENFRHAIENGTHCTADGHDIKFTVCIGVVVNHSPVNLDEALNQADLALYHAKHNGRNQVVLYESTMAMS